MTKYVCGPSWDRRLFDINPRGKVGLMITGGLDSWVLYNLLKHIVADIQLFTIKRVDGFDNPNRVRLLTGEDVIEIADTEIPNSQLRVTAGVDSILKTYDVDELYLALNRDPPIEHFPQFNISTRPFRPWRIDHPKIKVPFLHLYKYHIVDLANHLNIDVAHTLSCIANPETACGKCWQCLEREWGFEQLDQS